MRSFHERLSVVAPDEARVRYLELDVAPNEGVAREGVARQFVAMNHGALALLDRRGNEFARHRVAPGDMVFCADGDALAAGTYVMQRSQWHEVVLAEIPADARGRVRYLNVVEGVTVESREDDVTGLWRTRVKATPADRAPALALSPADEGASWPTVIAPLPVGAQIVAPAGMVVRRGALLAGGEWWAPPREHDWEAGIDVVETHLEARRTPPGHRAAVAPVSGILRYRSGDRVLRIEDERGQLLASVPRNRGSHYTCARDGDVVYRGEALEGGSRDHHELLAAVGPDAFAAHLADELEELFDNVGAPLASQHIALVVRAVLSRVRVTDAGDTGFVADEVAPRDDVDAANDAALARGGRPARYVTVLTGVSELGRDELDAAQLPDEVRSLFASTLSRE